MTQYPQSIHSTTGSITRNFQSFLRNDTIATGESATRLPLLVHDPAQSVTNACLSVLEYPKVRRMTLQCPVGAPALSTTNYKAISRSRCARHVQNRSAICDSLDQARAIWHQKCSTMSQLAHILRCLTWLESSELNSPLVDKDNLSIVKSTTQREEYQWYIRASSCIISLLTAMQPPEAQSIFSCGLLSRGMCRGVSAPKETSHRNILLGTSFTLTSPRRTIHQSSTQELTHIDLRPSKNHPCVGFSA